MLGAASSNFFGAYGTPISCNGVWVWGVKGYTLQTNIGNNVVDIIVVEDADQNWDALTTQRVCGALLPTDVSFISASGDTYIYSSHLGQIVLVQRPGYCHLYIS